MNKIFRIFISIIIFLILFIPLLGLAKEEEIGKFSGYVVSYNRNAEILKIEVDFLNAKYLNKKDMVEIVNSANRNLRCRTYIVGKTETHMLLKLGQGVHQCESVSALAAGAYIHFYSQDLVNNLMMGGELLNILVKKRLALHGMMMRKRGDVDGHMNKIAAINDRYQVLREKLELEWRQEITNLDLDKVSSEKELADLEKKLQEVDKKIEEYRLSDRNLELDRWSLDTNRFYLK